MALCLFLGTMEGHSQEEKVWGLGARGLEGGRSGGGEVRHVGNKSGFFKKLQ